MATASATGAPASAPTRELRGVVITPLRAGVLPPQRLPWTQLTVQYATPG